MSKLKLYLVLYGVLGLALVAIAQSNNIPNAGPNLSPTQGSNSLTVDNATDYPKPQSGPMLIAPQQSPVQAEASAPKREIHPAPKSAILPSKSVPKTSAKPQPQTSAVPKPSVAVPNPDVMAIDPAPKEAAPNQKSGDIVNQNPSDLQLVPDTAANKSELQQTSDKAIKQLTNQLKESKNIRDLVKK